MAREPGVRRRAAETFRTCYPDCQVEVQEVQLSDPFGPIRRGRVHLQVSEHPVIEPDMVLGPLVLTQCRVLMVPAGHPLGRRASVSLEDLAEATLLPVAAAVPRYWLDHRYLRQTPLGRPVPHGRASCYWTELLNLIGVGKGVCPASECAERYYGRPDIVWVPFSGAPPVEYGFFWPKAGETARIRAFVDTVHELC
ncbi:LysR substrate-binding domain-containing protein [Streptomyces sp. NBC_00868]|uniref:LysR substrate-binding domain-containing protein n=1 Tax=unclassified Streptomyces TaxID=2593676 RepID=UPI003255875E|nr:LysR substrate-binding domain-containing protein [Streptomyces sp. NBC_00868]